MQRFAAVAENISKQQGLRHPVFLKIGKSIYLHSSFSLLFFFSSFIFILSFTEGPFQSTIPITVSQSTGVKVYAS